MLFFPSLHLSFSAQVGLSDLRDSYLLVPQTKLPCIMTSRRCHFVGGLDIKKAEFYYSPLPLFAWRHLGVFLIMLPLDQSQINELLAGLKSSWTSEKKVFLKINVVKNNLESSVLIQWGSELWTCCHFRHHSNYVSGIPK